MPLYVICTINNQCTGYAHATVGMLYWTFLSRARTKLFLGSRMRSVNDYNIYDRQFNMPTGQSSNENCVQSSAITFVLWLVVGLIPAITLRCFSSHTSLS